MFVLQTYTSDLGLAYDIIVLVCRTSNTFNADKPMESESECRICNEFLGFM